MTDGPTERQLEVLRHIQSIRERLGYSPTIREIGDALNIRSLNGVNDHLKALERRGLLTRAFATARSIIPTSSGLTAIGPGSLFCPEPAAAPRTPHGEFSRATTEPDFSSAPKSDASEQSPTHCVNAAEKAGAR